VEIALSNLLQKEKVIQITEFESPASSFNPQGKEGNVSCRQAVTPSVARGRYGKRQRQSRLTERTSKYREEENSDFRLDAYRAKYG
jgi:uncharacterized sporulation protein YeaH/YhbH (DUF444 family)